MSRHFGMVVNGYCKEVPGKKLTQRRRVAMVFKTKSIYSPYQILSLRAQRGSLLSGKGIATPKSIGVFGVAGRMLLAKTEDRAFLH